MTERKTASTINDAELDQLYADRDRHETAIGEMNELATYLTRRCAGVEADLALADATTTALQEQLVQARQQLDHDQAAIRRVRHLHRPVEVVAAAEAGNAPDCAACRRAWPCQTYNALDEEPTP